MGSGGMHATLAKQEQRTRWVETQGGVAVFTSGERGGVDERDEREDCDEDEERPEGCDPDKVDGGVRGDGGGAVGMLPTRDARGRSGRG